MESIEARNELVNQLVEKLKKEYEAERQRFYTGTSTTITNLLSEGQGNTANSELDDELEYISFYSTLLMWVKTVLIDTKGRMFRAYIQTDGAGNAVFYVNTDCLEILLEEDHLIGKIGARFGFKFAGIPGLFSLEARNADRVLVSILEYAIHRKNKGE